MKQGLGSPFAALIRWWNIYPKFGAMQKFAVRNAGTNIYLLFMLAVTASPNVDLTTSEKYYSMTFMILRVLFF